MKANPIVADQKRFLVLAFIALVSSAIAGCAPLLTTSNTSVPPYGEAPVAVNFQTSYQFKLQALQHWRSAADFAAEDLHKRLQSAGICSTGSTCDQELFVKKPCEGPNCDASSCSTAFTRTFHDLLESALSKRGFQLSARASDSNLTIGIDSQAIQFSSDRPQLRAAGELVKLGEGVWALRDVASPLNIAARPNNIIAGRLVEPNSVIVPNWFKSNYASGDTPSHELLVNVSVINSKNTFGSGNNCYKISINMILYKVILIYHLIARLWLQTFKFHIRSIILHKHIIIIHFSLVFQLGQILIQLLP